jgi:hypothetical protein
MTKLNKQQQQQQQQQIKKTFLRFYFACFPEKRSGKS